ncbi:MAG TPA: hypothetical protein DCS21_04590 [Gammaproteobacteria bacterium]|nr:hypothetical protein [Gammaproteobacteria bacterium]
MVKDSRWRGNGEKRKPWELRPCCPAFSAARCTQVFLGADILEGIRFTVLIKITLVTAIDSSLDINKVKAFIEKFITTFAVKLPLT